MKIKVLILIVVNTYILSGCSIIYTNNEKNDSINDDNTHVIESTTSSIYAGDKEKVEVIDMQEPEEIIAVEIDDEIINNSVLIKGTYSKPESYDFPNTIIWESEASGEFIEVIVNGEINNFEIVSLLWNDETNKIEEDEVLYHMDNLINQVIVLCTYMPDGIPFEMIKWESISGELYTYIIADYSLAGDAGANQSLFILE